MVDANHERYESNAEAKDKEVDDYNKDSTSNNEIKKDKSILQDCKSETKTQVNIANIG